MFTRVVRGIDYYSKSRVFTYVTHFPAKMKCLPRHVTFLFKVLISVDWPDLDSYFNYHISKM